MNETIEQETITGAFCEPYEGTEENEGGGVLDVEGFDGCASADGSEEVPPHIRELSARVREAAGKVSACKDELKELRDAHAAALSALVTATGGDTSAAILTSSADAEPPEDWRTVSLDDRRYFPSLTRGIVKSLANSGISTLGPLADWTAAGKYLTDIAGIGQAKAELIEQATADYWAKFPPSDDPDQPDDNQSPDAPPAV